MAHNGIISLVGDIEARPRAAKRRVIASAEVGDEQKGEDPTISRLQERVADLLGKEAALSGCEEQARRLLGRLRAA